METGFPKLQSSRSRRHAFISRQLPTVPPRPPLPLRPLPLAPSAPTPMPSNLPQDHVTPVTPQQPFPSVRNAAPGGAPAQYPQAPSAAPGPRGALTSPRFPQPRPPPPPPPPPQPSSRPPPGAVFPGLEAAARTAGFVPRPRTSNARGAPGGTRGSSRTRCRSSPWIPRC